MQYVLATPGTLFWVVAYMLIDTGLGIEVVVPVAGDPALQGFDGVANLQLMHFQAQYLMLGVGAAVCGSIFLCAALIMAGFNRERQPDL